MRSGDSEEGGQEEPDALTQPAKDTALLRAPSLAPLPTTLSPVLDEQPHQEANSHFLAQIADSLEVHEGTMVWSLWESPVWHQGPGNPQTRAGHCRPADIPASKSPHDLASVYRYKVICHLSPMNPTPLHPPLNCSLFLEQA